MPHVKVLRQGHLIVFDSVEPRFLSILKPAITFVERQFLYGPERRQARIEGRSPINYVSHECFATDHKQRVTCPYGFFPRLKKTFEENGYTLELVDKRPVDKGKFVPDWESLDSIAKLRYRQRQILQRMVTRDQGRIDAPTGIGKSKLIAFACRLFSKSQIDIVTKSADVARNLYNELCGLLPDVGLVGASVQKPGHRVQLYVAKSLCHSPATADILIADECHELVSETFSTQLARYRYSRNFGLSATHNMRLDNKDMLAEAIFGPIIFKMDYEEAKNKHLIVPIRVLWTDVHMETNPCEGMDSIQKKRWGLWRNTHRNQLIAADARRHGPNEQVLITVNTVEHAVYLKSLLPEFKLVYSEGSMDEDRKSKYIKLGLITDKEPTMTPKRRQRMRVLFESGKLKKVIATTVWNVGVNFRRLSVLIRADGGGSPTMDTQIPGRVSRTCEETGKQVGVVRDYRDQFDRGMSGNAARRASSYKKHGWEQDEKPKTRSLFGRQIKS